MADVTTYLTVSNQTEAAFNFYKAVFGGEFESLSRFSDMPPQAGMPPLKEEEKPLIMHLTLKIMGGHQLMGSDAPASMVPEIVKGNNFEIGLSPDSREQTERLFHALAEGGEVRMPLQDTFWDAYYGSCTDKFGVRWMENFTSDTRSNLDIALPG